MKTILALALFMSSSVILVQPASACPDAYRDEGGWKCAAFCPGETC